MTKSSNLMIFNCLIIFLSLTSTTRATLYDTQSFRPYHFASARSAQVTVGTSFWFVSESLLSYMDKDILTGYKFNPPGRRDWYLIGNSWTEVNPSGTIRSYGPAQQTSIKLNNIAISGSQLAVGTAAMFIPDVNPSAISATSYIYYKSRGPHGEGTGGKWIPLAEINRVGDDNAMSLNLKLSFGAVITSAFASLPSYFDEKGMPFSDQFRWAFRLKSTGTWVDQGNVFFGATYQGDIETKQSGCHLRWVYPVITAQFKPVLTKGSVVVSPTGKTQWKATATQKKFWIALRADSDVVCGGIPIVFNMNVEDKLFEVLKGTDFYKKASDYVNTHDFSVPVPFEEIWSRISQPLDIGDASVRMCFYPAPKLVIAGNLQGGGSPSDFLLPATLINRSRVIVGKSCAELPPWIPSGPDVQNAKNVPDEFRVSTVYSIPYSLIKDRLEKANLGAAANVKLAYSFEGKGAYTELVVKTSGAITERFVFNVIPILDRDQPYLRFKFLPSPEDYPTHGAAAQELMVGLAKMFTENSGTDLKDDVAKVKERLARTHKFGNVSLSISLLNVLPHQCISDPDSVRAIVQFVGRAVAEIGN